VTDPPDANASPHAERPATLAEWRDQADRLLSSGAPLLAYEVLNDALEQFPSDVRLRQLHGLALSRTGASRQAIALLDQLEQEGHEDEETLGLLARAHKDVWRRERGSRDAARHLGLAHRYYERAYDLTRGIWSGINAATTALLLGRREHAASIARAVRERCLDRLRSPGPPDYWVSATLGEAALVLRDSREAEEAYRQAHAAGAGRPADIASTRRNARLVIQALDADAACIDEWLRLPRVAAFAGHLIDRPDRLVPRFPPELVEAARAALRERLAALDVGFGYSSAGCGADILFLECLAEMGAEATVVLPYNSEQFVRDSVDLQPGADWPQRYVRALQAAREVVIASDQRMAGGELSYEYAALLVDGMAGIQADELDTDLVSLALWDGRPGDGAGGTASTVARWTRAAHRVEIVDLAALLQRHQAFTVRTALAPEPPSGGQPAPQPLGGSLEPRIVTLLFADARGFSKLTEEQVAAFVRHFLGAVARVLSASTREPILKNTWGDGLYLVFEGVSDAGRCALDLTDAVNHTDWTAYGLPAGLTLRIGLHAGPAFACVDPVTGRPNFLGSHVSRAARIEPVTPPGQVYASPAFAALARAHGTTGLACEYVGRASLPKAYGSLALYLVRRRDDPEPNAADGR
jgi:class 3 adenylate cyclase/tetratricopeptide (TPR) repeat protein